ncbi:hypothetical protein WDU99_12095 [Microbacterium sp. Mu-80]|uniref:Uncharacterized protein n=1 Tax=Microbacterium bandirmense TaxID=3122050 RepID=A0ABU8LCK1_9MICO
MTEFSIERLPFEWQHVDAWARSDEHHTDWPVVYVLDSTTRARSSTSAKRSTQHPARDSASPAPSATLALVDPR